MHAFVLVFLAAALSPSDASPPPYELPQKAEVHDGSSTSRRVPGLQDVVTLTMNGVSDEIIINSIHTGRAVYHLSADEVVWLKQNSVHDCVIEAMEATANRRRR